jgi:hypothetical protein
VSGKDFMAENDEPKRAKILINDYKYLLMKLR